ncbi:hypothetical protein [Xylophilus sp. GOD-11R]|uniref:hypothetical protein n=1 Tax=Xylophilus sp. GOD-11R TaxID=3089814 RepID=UPI00298CE7D0|nr:hypothetical protein [Xylophilus sp. GOD-11R]WPB58623.1 hypothetical protein R9X41_08305 [Xylophilus sp. GOD-11R]
MNCGTCIHWELKGSPMRAVGMGMCAREVGVFRRARTFGPEALCGKKQFQQAAPAVVKAREKALARLEA